MGSQDSAAAFGFGGTRFEPDEFYESFQAPKFHDFTAPEEPIDPDAFFLAQPTGMVLKKAVVLESVKMMAPKIHKVTAQDIPELGAQRSPERVPPETVSAEKISPDRASRNNPCSSLLTLAMSNLKMLTTLSPFCACWSPGLQLREF